MNQETKAKLIMFVSMIAFMMFYFVVFGSKNEVFKQELTFFKN